MIKVLVPKIYQVVWVYCQVCELSVQATRSLVVTPVECSPECLV